MKNKVSFIVGENVIDDITFGGSIIDLIDSLPNVRLNVFDFINCVNTDGNMSYYNENYVAPFMKILENNAATYTVNIVLGFGEYKDMLSEKEVSLFETIMSNFILIDEPSRINKAEKEKWLVNLNNKSGIWVGPNIDNQNVFRLEHLSSYDIDDQLKNIIYVIEDANYVVAKGIGSEEEEEF